GAHQVDVLPPGEVVVEPGPQLQQRSDFSADSDSALVGDQHPGDQFEQSGFTRPVLADNTDTLAFSDRKGDVAQRPEIGGTSVGVTPVSVNKHLPQTAFAPAVRRKLDTEPFSLDDRLRHYSSLGTALSSRRNVTYPTNITRMAPPTVVHKTDAGGASLAYHTAWCIWKIPASGLCW